MTRNEATDGERYSTSSAQVVIHGRIRRGNTTVIGQAASIVTLVLLCIAVVVATHVYLRVAGSYPYFAVDDSLANVSVTLSNLGVYGMPAVPVQGAIDSFKLRIGGFYNYGPWPFYTGAALDWLFGSSYELQRFLHPLCLFVTFGIAFFAFRRLNVGLAALYAWLVLALLWSVMWPMVRPDPFTALFVVAAIASASGALLTEKRRYWFLCSFSAISAVTTHLVAIAVLPWSLFMLCLAIFLRRQAKPQDLYFRRFITQRLAAATLGGALALLVFLDAIDFRVSEFLQLATAVTKTRGGGLAGFAAAIDQQFTVMWGYAPRGISFVVALGTVCGGAALALLPFLQKRHAAVILSYFAPPATMSMLYLLSLGAYPFYHSGYALIGQLAFAWMAVAGFGVFGWLLADRVSMLGSVILILTPILGGVPLIAQANLTQTHGPSFASAGIYVQFSRYYEEVVRGIPSRALVLAGAIFGLESGKRHGLIQWIDATYRLKNLGPEGRALAAPDFLILNDYLRTLTAHSIFESSDIEVVRKFVDTPMFELLPGVRYRQAKIVYAVPYGTTIVYERVAGDLVDARPPQVAVFDRRSDSWLGELLPIKTPQVATSKPAHFDLPAFNVAGSARTTVAMELPAGAYLLEMQPESPGSGMFIATQTLQFASEQGVNLNFEFYESPIAPYESTTFLLARHPGGPLYVSLTRPRLEKPGSTLSNAFAIKRAWRLADHRIKEDALPLPPLSAWTGGDKIVATVQDDWLLVQGNDSAYGIQVKSPKIGVPRNTLLRFEMDLREIQGFVTVGVQSADKGYWLQTPQVRGVSEFFFNSGDNDQIVIMMVNVQPNHRKTVEFAAANPRLSKIDSALDRIYGFFGCKADEMSPQIPPPISGPQPAEYCKTITRP